MLSITGSLLLLACVKNLTVCTVGLYFLLSFVYVKDFLTQVMVFLRTDLTTVITSWTADLYTLTTPPTTNTIYLT